MKHINFFRIFADGEPTANTTVKHLSLSSLGSLDSLDERSGLSLFRRSSETSIPRFTSSPVHRNLMKVALLLLLIILHAPAWGEGTKPAAATPPTYSITYDCDNADSGCPENVASATALPNPLPAAPVKSGYTFDGWYTNSGKTTPAVAGATLTDNITLYAKWTQDSPTEDCYSTLAYSGGTTMPSWTLVSTSNPKPQISNETIAMAMSSSHTYGSGQPTRGMYFVADKDATISITAYCDGTSICLVEYNGSTYTIIQTWSSKDQTLDATIKNGYTYYLTPKASSSSNNKCNIKTISFDCTSVITAEWGYLGTGTAGTDTYVPKNTFPALNVEDTQSDVKIVHANGYYASNVGTYATDVKSSNAANLKTILLNAATAYIDITAINNKSLNKLYISWMDYSSAKDLTVTFYDSNATQIGSSTSLTNGNSQSALHSMEEVECPDNTVSAKIQSTSASPLDYVYYIGVSTGGSPTPAPAHRTITLDPNGGSFTSAPDGWTLSDGKLTAEVYENADLILPNCSIASRDGYTVVTDGWYDGTDSGNSYATVSYSSSVSTLYAHWTETPSPIVLSPLVSGEGYDVSDMLPAGATISGNNQYFSGKSANNRFEIIGNVAKTTDADGVPEIKTNTAVTIDGISFTEFMYLKGAANLSSDGMTPTSRSVKFVIDGTGTLNIYGQGDMVLYKEGDAQTQQLGSGSKVQGNFEIQNVTSGTYYVYSKYDSRYINRIKFTAPTPTTIAEWGYLGNGTEGIGNYTTKNQLKNNSTVEGITLTTSASVWQAANFAKDVLSQNEDIDYITPTTNGSGSYWGAELTAPSGETFGTIGVSWCDPTPGTGNLSIVFYTSNGGTELSRQSVAGNTRDDNQIVYTYSAPAGTTYVRFISSNLDSSQKGKTRIYYLAASLKSDEPTYDITASATPDGYGTVSPTSITGLSGTTGISANNNVLSVGSATITATPTETAQYTYAFSKWQINGVDYIAPTSVSAAATIKAVFTQTPRTYTIQYNLADGAWVDGYTAPTTYTFGTAPTLPTADNVTKTGYTFAGWDKTITAETTGDQTLTAQWTEIKVTSIAASPTSLDIKKGTSADVTLTISPADALDKEIKVTNASTTSSALKIGTTYTITGTSNGEAKDVTFENERSSKQVKVSVAVYYEVVYEENGGSECTNGKYYKSGDVTLPTPEKSGFDFAGWYTDNNTFEHKYGDGGAKPSVSDNITLYAKWTKQIVPYTGKIYPSGYVFEWGWTTSDGPEWTGTNGIFEETVHLKASEGDNSGFKFLTTRDWSSYYGATQADADKNVILGQEYNLVTTGDYKFMIAQAGDYRIRLDLTDKDNGKMTITAITLSSIEVKTAPTKVEYTAGDNFDPTGLVITKTMSDGSTSDVAYADESGNFSFSPSTSLVAGTTSVTITYGGKSTTQAITVTSAEKQYAVTADFATEARKAKDDRTEVSTFLSNNHYTISTTTGVSWDNQDNNSKKGDTGLKLKTNANTISFWVEANKQVTITLGTLEGKGSDGHAQLSMNNGEGIVLNGANTVSKDSANNGPYTTTEETQFVISFTATGWNILKKITIEDAPTTPTIPTNLTELNSTNYKTASIATNPITWKGASYIDLANQNNVTWEAKIVPGVYNISPEYGAEQWGVWLGLEIVYDNTVVTSLNFEKHAGAQSTENYWNNETKAWDLSSLDANKTYTIRAKDLWESTGSLIRLKHIIFATASSHTVTFAANGGTGTMNPVQVADNSEYTLPACTFTAPAGKEFDAWTSSDVTITNGKFTMPSKDVTVTATWKDAPVREYATDADFMELMAKYGSSGQYKNGVETELTAHHYTASNVSDWYWDYQPGAMDGGLGVTGESSLSFWVKANSTVTITAGTLNGDQNPNTAKLTINGVSADDIEQGSENVYTTKKEAEFVITTYPASTEIYWAWSRIHAINIETVEVCDAPVITAQSLIQEVTLGQSASFSITATGADSYQWYECNSDGENRNLILDATESEYEFTTTATGTTYFCCEATAECGKSIISAPIPCVVAPVDFTIHYVAYTDAETAMPSLSSFTVSKDVSTEAEPYILESNLTPFAFNGTVTTVALETGKKGTMSPKISMPTAEDASEYLSFSFTVQPDYCLSLSEIDIQAQPVGNSNHNYKVTLTDALGTTVTGSISSSAKGKLNKITFPATELEKKLVGQVVVKIFAWYTSSDTYRLAKNTYIKGQVESLPNADVHWTTAPVGNSVGAANQPFAAASNDGYTITYASSNTAVAQVVDGTSGKEIKYVAAGTAVITASVTGDGTHHRTGPTILSQRITVTDGCESATTYTMHDGTNRDNVHFGGKQEMYTGSWTSKGLAYPDGSTFYMGMYISHNSGNVLQNGTAYWQSFTPQTESVHLTIYAYHQSTTNSVAVWVGTQPSNATKVQTTSVATKTPTIIEYTNDNFEIGQTIYITWTDAWALFSNIVVDEYVSAPAPTIEWETAPKNGEVEGSMTATVRTNQTSPTITWASSNPDVATVTDAGVISYLSEGSTVISASYIGSGDYCAIEAKVEQTIQVSPKKVTYTVTYNNNGGTGTMTDTHSPYEATTSVALLSNTFTPPAKHHFDSWLVKDASDNTIEVSNNHFSMPASNVTVYAQWASSLTEPEVEWTVSGLTDGKVYPGGKYAIRVTTTSDAELTTDSLTATNATLDNVVVDAENQTITADMLIDADEDEAPTLTLTTAETDQFEEFTSTKSDITLGTCGESSTMVVFDGSYMTVVPGQKESGSDSKSGATWENVSTSATSITTMSGIDISSVSKEYTKSWQIASSGSNNSARHTKITIPQNYTATITLAGYSTNSNRSAFVATTPSSTASDEYVKILFESSNKVYSSTSDALEAGTYYVCASNGLWLTELSVVLTPVGSSGGGEDQTPTLTWADGTEDEGETDFIYNKQTSTLSCVANVNTIKGITYSVTSGADVASVNATTGLVTFTGKAGDVTLTASVEEVGCYTTASITRTIHVKFATNTFTTEGNWNVATNWSESVLPTSDVNVIIAAKATISAGTHAVANSIVINEGMSIDIASTASLQVEGTITRADGTPTQVSDIYIHSDANGNGALAIGQEDGTNQLTIELFSKARKVDGTKHWQYIGTPLQNGVDLNSDFYGAYTYIWNETSTGWIRVKTGDMTPFAGYGVSYNYEQQPTYLLSGTINSSEDRVINLTCTSDGRSGTNIAANSWTAPIDITKMEDTDFGDGLDKDIYIYNTGHDPEGGPTHAENTETAGVWNQIPLNTAKQDSWTGMTVIPVGQAFQLKTSKATTLTLDYSRVVMNPENTGLSTTARRAPQRVKDDQVTLIRFDLRNDNDLQNLYLLEDNRFTDGTDNGWDADFKQGNEERMQIYAVSNSGSSKFVEAKADLEGTPIAFVPVAGQYMYTIDFVYDLGTYTYYLNDLQAQTSTLIETGANYTFIANPSDDPLRFVISTTPLHMMPTGNDRIRHDEAAQKFIYREHMYIINRGNLFDGQGKLVK